LIENLLIQSGYSLHLDRYVLNRGSLFDTTYQTTFLHCIKFPYLAILLTIDGCWVRNVPAKKKVIQNWRCIYTLKV